MKKSLVVAVLALAMQSLLASNAFPQQNFYFKTSTQYLNELQTQSSVTWHALMPGHMGPPTPESGEKQDTSSDAATDAQSQVADNNTFVVYSLTDQVSDIGYGGSNLSASGLEQLSFAPQTGADVIANECTGNIGLVNGSIDPNDPFGGTDDEDSCRVVGVVWTDGTLTSTPYTFEVDLSWAFSGSGQLNARGAQISLYVNDPHHWVHRITLNSGGIVTKDGGPGVGYNRLNDSANLKVTGTLNKGDTVWITIKTGHEAGGGSDPEHQSETDTQSFTANITLG
jgi:hypothetical protein